MDNVSKITISIREGKISIHFDNSPLEAQRVMYIYAITGDQESQLWKMYFILFLCTTMLRVFFVAWCGFPCMEMFTFMNFTSRLFVIFRHFFLAIKIRKGRQGAWLIYDWGFLFVWYFNSLSRWPTSVTHFHALYVCYIMMYHASLSARNETHIIMVFKYVLAFLYYILVLHILQPIEHGCFGRIHASLHSSNKAMSYYCLQAAF